MRKISDEKTAVEAEEEAIDFLTASASDGPVEPPRAITAMRIAVGGPSGVLLPVTWIVTPLLRHWVDADDGGKRPVRCVGPECAACAAEFGAPEKVLLLPVVDVVMEAVAVLEINNAQHVGALGPQIKAVLKVAVEERRPLKVRRLDKVRWQVELLPATSATPGAVAVAVQLTSALDRKEFDPRVILPPADAVTLVRCFKKIRNMLRMVAPDHPALLAADSDEL